VTFEDAERASAMERAIAAANQVRDLPAFGDGVPLPFEASVTAAEADRLRLGLVSQTMEEKWNVGYEAPYLFFRRSWTGLLVHRVTLEPTDDGARLCDARWNAEVAGEPGVDLHFEARVLRFLVFQVILNRPGRFPLPHGV